MSLRETLRARISPFDVIGVGLMSIAAPWVAFFIYMRFAVPLGGMHSHEGPPQLSAWTVAGFAVACLLVGWPVFLLLIPFHKRAVFRWLAWICCVGFYVWFGFITGAASR